jgi:hypothetical protein
LDLLRLFFTLLLRFFEPFLLFFVPGPGFRASPLFWAVASWPSHHLRNRW